MKKRMLVSLFLVASSASAVVPDKANMVSVELGGPGLLYSVNYERQFSQRWGARVGASVFGLQEHSRSFPSREMVVAVIPVSGHHVFFDGNHHIELGAGGLLAFGSSGLNLPEGATESAFFSGASASVGYRYEASQSPLMVRVAFTPLFVPSVSRLTGLPVFPSAGLGLGYRF